MINLHILSITTNMEHPDSHQAQISQFFHVYCTGYGLNIKICGNHVGVLLSKPEADGADKFYILDWTTGTRKAVCILPNFTPLYFPLYTNTRINELQKSHWIVGAAELLKEILK